MASAERAGLGLTSTYLATQMQTWKTERMKPASEGASLRKDTEVTDSDMEQA